MKAALLLVALASPLHADESIPASGCRAELEKARLRLLAEGFAPAQDTAAALQVRSDGELSVFVAAAADSLHESYVLEIDRVAGADSPWRRRQRSICCDDFAEAEDHVTEQTWTRQRRGHRARVTTVTGRYPMRSRWVKLFGEIARRAADACL